MLRRVIVVESAVPLLAVAAATFPLLRRITGPETARTD
jgi:hypothetical protein